jgi:hypothetical protein
MNGLGLNGRYKGMEDADTRKIIPRSISVSVSTGYYNYLNQSNVGAH